MIPHLPLLRLVLAVIKRVDICGVKGYRIALDGFVFSVPLVHVHLRVGLCQLHVYSTSL